MPQSSPDAAPTRHPRSILFVLLLAGVSFALSQTMVVPALPAFQEAFGASASATSWLLTGYLLSASVATPIVGKLGDLHGKGRVLTIVLLLFSVGSLACALAPTIELLIAARVLQGVAGGVFPLAFGIVRDTFPRERVPGGLGLLSAIFGIGGGIGLPLAGVVVDHASVSLVFWFGMIALPAALAAHRLVPPSPTVPNVRIDWPGALLLSAALLSLLLGVTQGNVWGWSSAPVLALLAGGVLLLAVWARVEAGRPDPLIDLSVLRGRTVAATNLAAMLVGFAMFSSFLLVPQLAQTPESTGYGLGLSVTGAGLILAPAALAQLLVGPTAGFLGVRFGFRAVLAGGAACVATSFVWLTVEHASAWHLVVASVLLGAGISLALASLANLIVDAVRQSEVGVATGINTVTRTVGGAFGSAVVTAILTAEVLPATSFPAGGAYTAAFAIGAVGGVLALAAALVVPGRGSRHGTKPLVEVPAPASAGT